LYQGMAYDILRGKDKLFEEQKRIIEEYKAAGRRSEIQDTLKKLKAQFKAKAIDIPKELCYLTGEYRQMYLDDMAICQSFATLNREMIANAILSNLFGTELCEYAYFETIHNYIDLENNLVRKGAVSAQKGEMLLIPINMRDGSLICVGKGNEDWNCSAPHGAGRLLSRSGARDALSMEQYKAEMAGIFTTCVTESTIDESPMAYKNKDEIVSQIEPTADIVARIKPVYNFKAI
ncbi:MAG: RtcB family protein, partial [Eubacterium sp.]|nr:RtcB family protein [Eubacterium sp.]